MELLLALDFVGIDEAKEILREVEDCIDIVEVGTPLIVNEGLHAVAALKREFPLLRLMADLKIMDAGEYETRAAIDAGADIVTVLAVSNDATIRACTSEAHAKSACILVDLIGVKEIERRAREIDELGVDYLCVHTASDVQATGSNPLDELRRIKGAATRARLAVAGGITLSSVGEIISSEPAIVIVGGGITGQRDKRGTALELKRILEGRGEQINDDH